MGCRKYYVDDEEDNEYGTFESPYQSEEEEDDQNTIEYWNNHDD